MGLEAGFPVGKFQVHLQAGEVDHAPLQKEKRFERFVCKRSFLKSASL